ncbi:hypothetical protein BS78_K218500 [Paspalum vaginatum]|uniref:Uncharacterized protein n=1 Tax=Paspalum vaginatum TaxID=158149 RepID=A0A9W7X7P1_9POAL|nr:hypothetical protein BS78_K218500 [Paspalum vaginatum]
MARWAVAVATREQEVEEASTRSEGGRIRWGGVGDARVLTARSGGGRRRPVRELGASSNGGGGTAGSWARRGRGEGELGRGRRVRGEGQSAEAPSTSWSRARAAGGAWPAAWRPGRGVPAEAQAAQRRVAGSAGLRRRVAGGSAAWTESGEPETLTGGAKAKENGDGLWTGCAGEEGSGMRWRWQPDRWGPLVSDSRRK